MREELYHHGVEGQIHGVRNGPPYPLKGVGKAASNAARNVMNNTLSQKIIKKTTGEDKNRFFTKDDIKTILKGAAIAAATAGMAKVFGNLGDMAINAGKAAASRAIYNIMQGQGPISSSVSDLHSLIDMMRIDGVL